MLAPRGRFGLQGRYGILFAAPFLVHYAIFFVGPALYAFTLSLQRYDLLGGFQAWVGIGNYIRLWHDPVFLRALANTLFYVLGVVPTQTALALVVAIILDLELRGRTFFRVAYYLPTVTSSVVMSMIFLALYSNQGLLNALLQRVGLPGHNWLDSTRLALPSIMAMNVWSTVGTFMVIYMAALQDIPSELYDAARVDGASPWQQVRYLVVPMLRPTTFFVAVMGVIGSFQVFDQMYIMTDGNGGPLNSTMTLMLYLYKNAFGGYNRMGYASALAVVLFFMILAVSLIQRKLFPEEVR